MNTTFKFYLKNTIQTSIFAFIIFDSLENEIIIWHVDNPKKVVFSQSRALKVHTTKQ